MRACAEDLDHTGTLVDDRAARTFVAATTLGNVEKRALKRLKLADQANTPLVPDRPGRVAGFVGNRSDIHALFQGQLAPSEAQLAPPSSLVSTAWARDSGFNVTAWSLRPSFSSTAKCNT